jgi:FixJ family two-component response regulator
MADERRPPTVAVIEDDEVSRCALGRILRVAGFEPALYDSAEAFIAAPRTSSLRCLIVDVQLTGMSGIDLQTKLSAEGSEVPVIITTGNRADVIRRRAQQAGCAAFLWKPFCAETLLEIIAFLAPRSHT